MTDQPSRAVQDYLKAIHSQGGAEQMVSPLAIAARLQVRAPSVTGMLKRLADGGWIDYEPHVGALLTQPGISEARRVIRRHRLVELFLTRVLGLDWSEVDAEAEALEHAISPRLEQAIAAHLGEPLEDPHGHPIPTREGAIARRTLQPRGAQPCSLRESHATAAGAVQRATAGSLIASKTACLATFRLAASPGASWPSASLRGVCGADCSWKLPGSVTFIRSIRNSRSKRPTPKSTPRASFPATQTIGAARSAITPIWYPSGWVSSPVQFV